MKVLVFLIVAGIISCCGCDNSRKGKTDAEPSEPSAARSTIEGLTGATAVKAGEQAKDKIRAISAQENRNLNEVLDK